MRRDSTKDSNTPGSILQESSNSSLAISSSDSMRVEDNNDAQDLSPPRIRSGKLTNSFCTSHSDCGMESSTKKSSQIDHNNDNTNPLPSSEQTQQELSSPLFSQSVPPSTRRHALEMGSCADKTLSTTLRKDNISAPQSQRAEVSFGATNSIEAMRKMDTSVRSISGLFPSVLKRSSWHGSGNILSNRSFFASRRSTSGIGFVNGAIAGENEEDEDDFVDPIMEAMDRIEDEIDGHTYDDLVPLSIRMALEESVFGWNHIFSEIAGHILYTALAYLFTYYLFTFFFLKKVETDTTVGYPGEESSLTVMGRVCGSKLSCNLSHVKHWFQDQGGDDPLAVNGGSNDSFEPLHDVNGDSESNMLLNKTYSLNGTNAALSSSTSTATYEYVPILGMSQTLFAWLRFLLSTLSAISAFRTVRRRRMVWLRSPYGTTEYLNDAHRRSKILVEADQTTVIGRIREGIARKRDAFLSSRVRRKLKRAENRFEKRRKNMTRWMGSLRNGVSYHHHQRVKVLSQDHRLMKSCSGSSETLHQDYERSKASNQNEWHSHTMPPYVTQSISKDQIRFPSGPIQNIPYAHGGFFGAAPFMLADPRWIDILRHLMPDVYVEISRRALRAPVFKLIKWAENNPVVAAYGTAHEAEYSGRVSTLEWDVFLDPYLVQRVEIVLNERNRFLLSIPNYISLDSQDENATEGLGFTDGINAVASSLESSERTTLQYYNAEILRRTNILVERMLIAHGNLTQLALEQTGFAKNYNFSRVKRTRRTLGGGIFAKNWCAVYAQALMMGMDYEKVNESFLSSPAKSTISMGCSEDSTVASLCSSPSSSSYASRSNSDDEVSTEDAPLLASDGVTEKQLGCINLRLSQSSGCESYEGKKSRSSSPNYHSLSPPSCGVESKDYCGTAAWADKSPPNDDSILCHSTRKSSFKKATSDAEVYSPIRHRFGSKDILKELIKKQAQAKTTSLNQLAQSTCPNTSISESISLLKAIMKCNAPLGLVLDIKSQHVPKCIWALIVDNLREAGARVEGVASFAIHEIRDISYYCSSPVKEIIFFHSAGDMQQACNAGLMKPGDKLFFNAGSLLWERPKLNDCFAKKDMCLSTFCVPFNADETKRNYTFRSFARVSNLEVDCGEITCSPSKSYDPDEENVSTKDSSKALLQTLLADNVRATRVSPLKFQPGNGSTIQQYKEHYRLSIGLYCQEFAIDDTAINLLVEYVNKSGHVFDLGLSWGGVNGVTISGIQPGRFTSTDGFWNQRYAGASWDETLCPTASLE